MTSISYITRSLGLALGAILLAAAVFVAVPLFSAVLSSSINPVFSAAAPSIAYADDGWIDSSWSGGDCCGGGLDTDPGWIDSGWDYNDCCNYNYNNYDYGNDDYDYYDYYARTGRR